MVVVSLEGVLVAVGWSISVVLWAFLYKKSRNIEKNMSNIWNTKVELQDLNGQVIKVPVKTAKGEDADGNPVFETKMVIAPLWYTIATIGGTMAVEHFKGWFMNQKSQLSKGLGKAALGEAAAGGDLMGLMSMLPKKAQAAVALIMAAKNLGKGGQQGGQQQSGGGKAI